jgi:signal transduction histidine kinase
LAIHWGAPDFPVTPGVNDAIRDSLATYDGPVDYFAEYLESDRIATEDATQALADYIRQKYRGRRIDLVLAIADPALRFVLDRQAELFPDTAIVYSGVAIPDGGVRTAHGGLTAVMRGVAYGETLRLALDLQPSTERVFVIARRPDRQTVESVRAELLEFSKSVPLTYLDQEKVPDLLAAVKAVPPRSLILYVYYSPNDPGFLPDLPAVARQVVEASPVPVYGTNERYIGSGVVGGVVRGSRATGTRMGEMALQILNGTSARDIPVENARLVPTIDWRQLQRWGIDASRLPPGSNIQFRTATAWESYRGYIIGALVVVAAQLLLIAGLLVQRARRRRAEETLLAREATIRTSYERIRQLARGLINAQEAVRADIARDLHDGVCQELTGMSIEVATLKDSPGSIQDAPTQDALSKLQDETRAMFDGIRRLSHELHPATLRVMGLASALRAHCAEVEKRHGLEVKLTTEGHFSDLQPDVAVCFFRIAQESLRNGIVHGAARRIAVSLTRVGEQVELTVTDDGWGFDLEAVRRNGGGLGLVSIEERAYAIGGNVEILTGLEKGTTIFVRGPARSATGASRGEPG